jgi:Copper/zinc superoxide dismutase (SODC)
LVCAVAAIIVVILITNQGKTKSVNPFGKQHGAPCDSDRHVGDLGNFKTDGQGNSQGSIEDSQVKLIGEHSVLGVCPKSPPPQFPTLIPPHLSWFFPNSICLRTREETLTAFRPLREKKLIAHHSRSRRHR